MDFLAAQATDPAAAFLQYGALGALVVILGGFAWTAYKRERDRADRLEKQVEALNERITDKFADLAKGTRDALTDVNDYLRDLLRRERRP